MSFVGEPSPPNPNSTTPNVAFTLQVSNAPGGTLNDVALWVVLPKGFAFSTSPETCQADGATVVRCALGTLSSPRSVVLNTSPAGVLGSGTAYMVAGVATTSTETNRTNNGASKTFIMSTAPAPTVTAISPSCASTTGGRAVTITGTNFTAGATVSLDGTAATVTNVTPTTITATVGSRPAAPKDLGDVVVTNPNSQFGTLSNAFTYALRGDANNNGALTGADSFYLNLAIFLGGTPVASLCNGDANGNNSITAADSFYLNIHIFLGGAPPGP